MTFAFHCTNTKQYTYSIPYIFMYPILYTVYCDLCCNPLVQPHAPTHPLPLPTETLVDQGLGHPSIQFREGLPPLSLREGGYLFYCCSAVNCVFYLNFETL